MGFPAPAAGLRLRPLASPWVPLSRQWFAPNTPPRRRVLRPAPLPVVAGPYIRCPPALGSAAATAATTVMLSRSRCVSRAFSRSLSAFQKVRCGLARPGRVRNPLVGSEQPGGVGRGAAGWPGQAPRAPGRGGRGLGGPWLPLPSETSCGAQRPLGFPRQPAPRLLLYSTFRAWTEPSRAAPAPTRDSV